MTTVKAKNESKFNLSYLSHRYTYYCFNKLDTYMLGITNGKYYALCILIKNSVTMSIFFSNQPTYFNSECYELISQSYLPINEK